MKRFLSATCGKAETGSAILFPGLWQTRQFQIPLDAAWAWISTSVLWLSPSLALFSSFNFFWLVGRLLVLQESCLMDSLLCCNPISGKISVTPGLKLCFLSYLPHSLFSSLTRHVKNHQQSDETELFERLAPETRGSSTESTAGKRPWSYHPRKCLLQH